MSAFSPRWRLWIQIGVAAVVLIAVFAWSEGLFRRKVGPGDAREQSGEPWHGATAVVETRTVPVILSAVGTVRPIREATISARVMGVLETVEVREGDRVQKGQALAVLSAPELTARSAAADQAVASAEAAVLQARSDFARMDELFEKDAATRVEWERARTALSVAESELARARRSAEGEAAVASYAKLRAPFDGLVLERRMDPGDLAGPGHPILRIADDGSFRLEAAVEEGQAGRVRQGDEVGVAVDAIGFDGPGIVDEVVPVADPQSRTSLIKVALPETPGLRSGQFGRLRLPVGEREAVVVASGAIRTIGGVQLVHVLREDGGSLTRYIRAGREVDRGLTEVLAGLSPGERVALPPQAHD